MSDFAPPKSDQIRLQRSVLSVPAINPRMFSKALNSEADYIMLDCEDSVAAADKADARRNVIVALEEIDWKARGKSLMVRVNALSSPHHYRDMVDIIEAAGASVDSIMLPRPDRASDIAFVDTLLGQIEQAANLSNRIAIEALIETASAAININLIATASPRLQALHFGAGDFAASCGARTVEIGGLHENFPGDPWHPVMQSIVLACRANGLRPIDSAYGDFKDTEGYLAAARRAAVLGFAGKWVIHPSQIALANSVMSPSAKEVTSAQRVLDGMAIAEQAGQGAAMVDSRMVDAASVRMAANVVGLDSLIRRKNCVSGND